MSEKSKNKVSSALIVTLSAAVVHLSDIPKAIAQTVSCIQPLVFGTIVTCNAANTVTITPSGSRTLSGCLTPGGGPFSRGRCLVFGTFPPVPIVISVAGPAETIAGGGDTMVVNGFNLVTNAGGNATTITGFTADIPFGATLNVTNPQLSGTYTGTFTLNANY